VVKIPIILYNNYGACGTNLTPGFVQRMSKIENIRYLKEADGDLLQFRAIKDACPDDFHMLVGCDTIAYELFKNGATGWISISANALTKQCQTIFECMKNGQEDKAWEIFKVCLPIYAACESSYKAIQTIKYIMDRLGCCGGMSRPPRLPLTEEEKSKIDNMMRQANLL
jgi:dihydrodipicolinate synthase/N-acetylneuraminate lyase